MLGSKSSLVSSTVARDLVDVAKSTIERSLHQLDLRAHHKMQTPVSLKKKIARIVFVEKYAKKLSWNKVLFRADEMSINLY